MLLPQVTIIPINHPHNGIIINRGPSPFELLKVLLPNVHLPLTFSSRTPYFQILFPSDAIQTSVIATTSMVYSDSIIDGSECVSSKGEGLDVDAHHVDVGLDAFVGKITTKEVFPALSRPINKARCCFLWDVREVSALPILMLDVGCCDK